jgi:hypothetical protein
MFNIGRKKKFQFVLKDDEDNEEVGRVIVKWRENDLTTEVRRINRLL